MHSSRKLQLEQATLMLWEVMGTILGWAASGRVTGEVALNVVVFSVVTEVSLDACQLCSSILTVD